MKKEDLKVGMIITSKCSRLERTIKYIGDMYYIYTGDFGENHDIIQQLSRWEPIRSVTKVTYYRYSWVTEGDKEFIHQCNWTTNMWSVFSKLNVDRILLETEEKVVDIPNIIK